MKRPLPMLASALVLLLAGLAGYTYFYLYQHVTPAAADALRHGMTRAQVERILGGPAGKYFRWCEAMPVFDDLSLIEGSGRRGELWIADDFAIVVWFDSADRVAGIGRTHKMQHGMRGFYRNGENVMPGFLMNWLGWDQDDGLLIEIAM